MLAVMVFAVTYFALNNIVTFIVRRRETQWVIQREFNRQSWVDLGAA